MLANKTGSSSCVVMVRVQIITIMVIPNIRKA